ncbi:MAG: IS4 family transposase [Planctomycetes bacterium]|nr:IS4 family transposase [Planctomycetota bacterium]
MLDRGYAAWELLRDIIDAGSSFVVRVKSNVVFDVIEERELRKEDRDAGVYRDVVVRLGNPKTSAIFDQPLRLVTVLADDGTELVLCSDLLDIEADLVSEIYKSRWQIELFFRWLKQIVGISHLISESENGVALQVYSALIASIVIVLWTGRKPTKRTFEMMHHWYMIGWAGKEDVDRHLGKLAKLDELKKQK